jgi:hypothetical protein
MPIIIKPPKIEPDDFEGIALSYFKKEENLLLEKYYTLSIGVHIKKQHRFDLGNDRTLVECKYHTWTKTNGIPHAKLSVWNEAMYYFHLAPKKYRKIFFVLQDFSKKRNETLLQYYIKTFYCFIPNDVLFYEYSLDDNKCSITDFEDILQYHR